jgi:chloride channel 2
VAGLSDGHTDFSDLGENYAEQYFLWVLWRILMGLAAVSVTHYVSPIAAGSGIPEMRSILGGFELTNYLTLRTLFAKVFGLILAQGAGLNVGKEGPFVHTSAVVSAQMLKLPAFRQILESPALTHNVLSAACAVGVASTFGAPVGGVLFSIEVTTIFYHTRNYWQVCFSYSISIFYLIDSVSCSHLTS